MQEDPMKFGSRWYWISNDKVIGVVFDSPRGPSWFSFREKEAGWSFEIGHEELFEIAGVVKEFDSYRSDRVEDQRNRVFAKIEKYKEARE
jgi:hypothetical protein